MIGYLCLRWVAYRCSSDGLWLTQTSNCGTVKRLVLASNAAAVNVPKFAFVNVTMLWNKNGVIAVGMVNFRGS